MRAYKNKNLGGGLLYEFINCCEALIIAVKNKDDIAVKEQFKKLDSWELEYHNQNKLICFAKDDLTPGVNKNKLLKLIDTF